MVSRRFVSLSNLRLASSLRRNPWNGLALFTFVIPAEPEDDSKEKG